MDQSKYTKGGSEVGPVDPSDWYAFTTRLGPTRGECCGAVCRAPQGPHIVLHRLHQIHVLSLIIPMQQQYAKADDPIVVLHWKGNRLDGQSLSGDHMHSPLSPQH